MKFPVNNLSTLNIWYRKVRRMLETVSWYTFDALRDQLKQDAHNCGYMEKSIKYSDGYNNYWTRYVNDG